MTNSFTIIKQDFQTIYVNFTIDGIDYTQQLLTHWEGADLSGNPTSGGIRIDTPENTNADLTSYMNDYAAGIAEAKAAQDIVS